MQGLDIKLKGWMDGEYAEQEMDETDRWVLHTADELTMNLAGVSVTIKQQPKGLNATRLGVGACVWEGELLLAAYLASLPLYKFMGARVIELGSGPGLVGMMLAKLGAKVAITDIGKVLPLIEDNITANGLARRDRGEGQGWAEALELEWGVPGYEKSVEVLAAEPVDWVLAADCCYIDNEGTSPSTPHFVQTCRGLCTSPNTRVLVSFELRSKDIKRVFLTEAEKVFSKVTRVPPTSLPKGCQVEHIELYDLKL